MSAPRLLRGPRLPAHPRHASARTEGAGHRSRDRSIVTQAPDASGLVNRRSTASAWTMPDPSGRSATARVVDLRGCRSTRVPLASPMAQKPSLITQRSQVQILPPLQSKTAGQSRVRGSPRARFLRSVSATCLLTLPRDRPGEGASARPRIPSGILQRSPRPERASTGGPDGPDRVRRRGPRPSHSPADQTSTPSDQAPGSGARKRPGPGPCGSDRSWHSGRASWPRGPSGPVMLRQR